MEYSEHVECQLSNEISRDRIFPPIIESSDPNLLAAISQVKSGKKLKSEYEEMDLLIFPLESVDSNKDENPKNNTGIASDAKAHTLIIGGHHRISRVDLKCHMRSIFRALSKTAKDFLCR